MKTELQKYENPNPKHKVFARVYIPCENHFETRAFTANPESTI
jgi:hypothetical protein